MTKTIILRYMSLDYSDTENQKEFAFVDVTKTSKMVFSIPTFPKVK